MKNAKAEFGKKMGKALGNALFGEYGEDKRIGIRYSEGSTSRKRAISSRQNMHNTDDVARIMAEQKLLEMRIKAEKERLEEEHEVKREEAVSRQLAQKASALSNIEFDEANPKQIVLQMNKIATITEMALNNNDEDDDHIGIAAISMYRTGLSILRVANPNHSMIPHFEEQLKLWSQHEKKKKFEKMTETIWVFIALFISFAGWYGIFLLFKSCQR